MTMVCDRKTMLETLFKPEYDRYQEQAVELVEDWQAFMERFAAEKDCYEYLFGLKWPEGYICPRCDSRHASVIRTRKMPLYQCRSCSHQTTLTAGTIMEGTRTPLYKWLTAFFFISRTDIGINALELKTLIGVTYKTAWSMFRQIREAISKVDAAQPLTGLVQGYCGIAHRSPAHSAIFECRPQEKPVLIGAAIDREQLGYIKMKLVPLEHMDGKRLLRSGIRLFEEKHAAEGASVNILPRMASRQILRLKTAFDKLLEWLTRTYGSLGSRYLQSYLDEICYYVNLNYLGISIFESLSQLSMTAEPYRRTMSPVVVSCSVA